MDLKVTSESSKGKGIPEGAEILKKDTRVSVEEIENGFIVCKTSDIKYQIEERTDWAYITKKYYSKKNPLEIKINNKSLSDDFK